MQDIILSLLLYECCMMSWYPAWSIGMDGNYSQWYQHSTGTDRLWLTPYSCTTNSEPITVH